MKNINLKLFGLICFITVWWISSCLYGESIYFLSSPQEVAQSLIHEFSVKDLLATGYRWILGFCAGHILGIFFGFILGVSPVLFKCVELPLEFFRSTPPAALLPLFFVFFGVGDKAKIAISAFPSFLITVLAVMEAARNVSQTRLLMLSVFKANIFQKFYYVIVPETLPHILVASKISLSLSLTVVIVAEMLIGSEFGLGQRIYDAYLTSNINVLYANVVVCGVIGTVLNLVISDCIKRSSAWMPRI